MNIKPIAAFRANVRACWITTYNLDLGLYDSFLLPRLGDPPLNAVVLADGHQLDKVLDRIPADEPWRLERANKRWLLRGMSPGGAFHPKTLLLAGKTTTRLLVGSGNVSLSGLDVGNETFVEFTSDTPEGAAAIAAWVTWINRLLDLHGHDEQLAARFAELVTHLPSTIDVDPGGLVHNLDRPILDQLVDAIRGRPVQHVHLAAPFFDEHAAAVKALIGRLQPDQVTIYVAADASVDGRALRAVLDESGAACSVQRYVDENGSPVGFVHAKLIGAVLADGNELLLSGSANLSRAALQSVVGREPYANVEAGTITKLDGSDVVAAFTNLPVLDSEPMPIERIEAHEFSSDEEPSDIEIRLVRAQRGRGGGVTATATADWNDDWLLSDGEQTVRNGGVLNGRMIWIINDAREFISNRVIVDEPDQLSRQLQEQQRSSSDKPPELNPNDLDHPLGAVLFFLQQTCIMDVAETSAVQLADRGTDDQDEADATDLWEKLASAELRRDPRISTYERIVRRTAGMDDPLADLLANMLARSPELARSALANVIALPVRDATDDDDPDIGGDVDRQPRRWSTNTRIRIRARNVLRRWAAAVGDERLQWIDPAAPLTNFRALIDALGWLYAIHHLSEEGAVLTEEDLDDIFFRLLSAALPVLLDADDLDDQLPYHTLPLTTALLYLDTRVGFGQRARILAWQPILQDLLDADLLRPTITVGQYASDVLERPVTVDDMLTTLLEAIDYIDDREWSRRTVEELGLIDLELEDPPAAQLDVRVRVRGITAPLTDPTTARLVGQLRRYRDADSIAVFDADSRWRLVVSIGDPVALSADWIDDAFVESLGPLSAADLDRLVRIGSSFADLFAPQHRSAA